MKAKLILSSLLSFYFCLLSSQVPQGFNYQAIARDGTSGNPIINTPLPVTITIQSESTGGTVFWKEEHPSVTTNSFGVFNLMVGKGNRQSGLDHFYDIDWTVSPKYIKTQIFYLGELKDMGTSELLSVPYSMVAGNLNGTLKKLEVKSQTDVMDEALFEVKNKTGQTVFAVYNEGVRVYVDNGIGAKGAKGGFAIGGFGTTKDNPGQDYFIVDPTQIRMYFDQTISPVKSAKGGFAIGGFGTSKGTIQNFLRINNDSTRFFINDDPLHKGAKGGFAIGGFGTSKGNTNFFNVETATSGLTIIDPSENRILFHPLKNAFMVGRVLIKNVSDVGENSFVSGFESVATGDQSQSMGYKTVALGKRSTAMGSESRAEGWFSFAMGGQSVASGMNAAAIGGYCLASGGNAMAMGWLSTASGPASFAIGNGCTASASNSQAMGWGSEASGQESTAIGNACVASGLKSFAFGDVAKALNDNSYSFGKSSQAKGKSSYAIGESVIAGGETSENCYAFGKSTQATGNGSYAFGDGAIASGTYATAFGKLALASNTSSFAFGESAHSSSENSFAMGKGAIASGPNSFAIGTWGQDDPGFGTNPEGSYTTSSGAYSFAGGQGAIASGDNSVSIGFCTRAGSQACVALGMGSLAEGNHSAIAIGEYTKSSGNGSVALGYWTVASNTGSVALCHGAIASGEQSLAAGYGSHSFGGQSFAMGYQSNSHGNGSIALGNFASTGVNARSGLSVGWYTEANGSESFASGFYTVAAGGQSQAFGDRTTAEGGASTSFGWLTSASANYAVAMGEHTNALSYASLVLGRYNIPAGTTNVWYDWEPAFVIGNGTSASSPSNAFTILKNGNVGIGYSSPSSALHVEKPIVGHAVYIKNSYNNGATGNGIYLCAGQDGVNTGADLITFCSPNGTSLGAIRQSGAGSISIAYTSDARLKEDIVNTSSSIVDLMKIKVRDFNYISDNSKTRVTGFIAQELYDIFPEAVSRPLDEKNYWGVDYAKVTPLIVKAVQDQEQTIETLSKENQELKSQVQILQEKMEQIELLLAKKDVK